MKLSRVAQRFNDTPCRESYTGDFLFNAQLGVYTDAVRDGVTTQRRILELAPDLVPPARRTIEFEGVHWILGLGNIDTWKGRAIRTKYPIHQSMGLANVMTPLELLSGTEGLRAHAGLVFTKTNKEVEESSNEYSQSTMYFSTSEPVMPEHIIRLNADHYITKETYPATAGHLGVIVEKVDEPILEVAQTQGKRNPITEQYEPGPDISVIRLRWQTDFQYYSLMTPTFERGDMKAITLSTPVHKVGDKLTMSDGVWKIISNDKKMGVQHLHMRRDR